MEAWREELHEDLYHAFKGREWKNHKYIRKEGNRYIYPEDLKNGKNKGWLSDAANAISNTASSVASTVGTYATTAASAVSNTANTVAQEASNVWNSVSTAVGSTATSVYNNISATVNSAIESLKNNPSWPKQKGEKPNSDGSSRATMVEKKEGPWNERLNTYIKARLAKIGDDQEQFEELYTAVSWLVAKALYNMDSKKVATPSTPLWHGLDAASLAQAIGVDPSDASSDMYTSLMYCLWSVLDAKRIGSKNPLVEGKKEHNIVQNAWNSVTGKTQQAQNALARVNANSSKRTSTTQSANRSVVIKPKRQSLSQSDIYTDELYHHGIKDQRWGVRRFQNEDGSLTEAGRDRYGISKKDTKWATKNRKKITNAAYNASKRELNEYATELLRQPGAKNANGRLSAATINAYNRRMAELMSQKVSELLSPDDRVINFVAKRGEIGVHMALSDAGYDISQLRNGVWENGRIAYRKKVVDRIEG